MKKIFVFAMSILLIISNPIIIGASGADSEANTFTCGENYTFVAPTQETLIQHLSTDNSIMPIDEENELMLPSTVDNSQSIYFPTIGNQGVYGACATWASVYYLYTYEVNRYHNTAATMENEDGSKVNIDANVYSPTWVYSIMSNNTNTGICMDWIFDFTIAHGQIPLEELPYYSSANPYPSAPTDPSIVVNALSTRASNWYSERINTNTTPIESVDSNLLTRVKQLLASGHILEINNCAGYNIKSNSLGESCVYRTYSSDGHALTVVGYDDTVWCDINGNNAPDEGEHGAFKIANSWGSSWGNDGFIWFAYDSLNTNSVVDGDWEESLPGTRKPSFCLNWDYNWLTYIDVQDYNVNYACLSNVTIANPAQFRFNLQRTNANDFTVSAIREHYFGATDCLYNRTFLLAYDYADLASPLPGYLEDHIWSAWVSNSQYASINWCNLVDNKANTIKPYALDLSTNKWNCELNLLVGDMNYDGVLSTSDVSILFDCVSNPDGFSNVQLYLADYNGDGFVGTADVRQLFHDIVNSDGNVYTMDILSSDVLRLLNDTL